MKSQSINKISDRQGPQWPSKHAKAMNLFMIFVPYTWRWRYFNFLCSVLYQRTYKQMTTLFCNYGLFCPINFVLFITQNWRWQNCRNMFLKSVVHFLINLFNPILQSIIDHHAPSFVARNPSLPCSVVYEWD